MYDTYDITENNKKNNDNISVKMEIKMEMEMEMEIRNKAEIQRKKIEECKKLTSQPHCNANKICDWNGIKNECNITPDCINLSHTECKLQKNKCSWEIANNLCRINYE